MADPNNTIDVLEDLIQTCKDGEDGYLHAASQASDPELLAFFRDQSIGPVAHTKGCTQKTLWLCLAAGGSV